MKKNTVVALMCVMFSFALITNTFADETCAEGHTNVGGKCVPINPPPPPGGLVQNEDETEIVKIIRFWVSKLF